MLLAALILAAALLYSSVGHAGASGYLAAMALFGLAPEVMRPTALVLNLLVGSIATLRFCGAGHFRWRVLWPFILGSIPLAFLGGALQLPGSLYKQLVGLLLLFAAARLLWSTWWVATPGRLVPAVPVVPAVASGAVIGILAGLTGTGGGVFLSPLLLFTGWSETRQSGAVTAPFIVANSLAGLAGNLASVRSLPAEIPVWAAAAVVGGLVGAELGSRRLATTWFRRVLALVLVVAALKLLFA